MRSTGSGYVRIFLERDIVLGRDRLSLDHPVHVWLAGTFVQLTEGFRDVHVGARPPLVVTEVLYPCWNVIALAPEFRIFQVAEQRPPACAIANPDASATRHGCQEGRHIILIYNVVDHHQDWTAARPKVETQRRFPELVQRIQVE